MHCYVLLCSTRDRSRFSSCGEMQGQRPTMEDEDDIILSLSAERPDWGMFGVYDGHSGKRAATFIKQNLSQKIAQLENPHDPVGMIATLLNIDAKYETSVSTREKAMGSTCVYTVVEPLGLNEAGKKTYRLTTTNVGDSRAILISKSTESIIGLTTDHKPEDPVDKARVEAAGGYVGFKFGIARVDDILAMSRSVGDHLFKGDLKRNPLQQKVVALADVTTVTAEEGDILLICCDGMFEVMSSMEVANYVYQDVVEHENDPHLTITKLLNESLRRGSKDNMTAMMIMFADGRAYHKPGYEFIPEKINGQGEVFTRSYLVNCLENGKSAKEVVAELGANAGKPADVAALLKLEESWGALRAEPTLPLAKRHRDDPEQVRPSSSSSVFF